MVLEFMPRKGVFLCRACKHVILIADPTHTMDEVNAFLKGKKCGDCVRVFTGGMSAEEFDDTSYGFKVPPLEVGN